MVGLGPVVSPLPAEVALSAAYSLVLLAVATVLDRLARHVAARSERFRTAGFRYHPDHDAWVCPQDQWLWPEEFDPAQRLVRYRAKPSVCSACPVRDDCTSSPHGRELVRAVDPWPHSETGRFHRGLALVLVSLAGLLLAVVALRHPQPGTLAVLAVPLLLTGLVAWRFSAHFRATPAGFPGAPVGGPPATVAPPTSRSRYHSEARR